MSSSTLRDVAKDKLRERGKEPATGAAIADNPDAAADQMESRAVALAEDAEFLATTEVKVARIVTVPVLKFAVGMSIICQIKEPIHLGPEIKQQDGSMKAAPIVQIASPRGQVRVIVAGSVLQSELERAYPEQGYVGRWFGIKKVGKDEAKGKRYHTYQIVEINDPRGKADIDGKAE